jgi:hypothetical protein
MRLRSARRELDPVWLLLVAAALASAGLLLALGSRLTFLLDDWEFLLYRPGFSAHSILEPHGEHISVAPILIYKALLATVGMESSVPFLAVSVALFLATVLLLFIYLRRRVDPWLALLAAAVVLFLGPAFDDLLWVFQMGFLGSLACGLGAVVLLERGDRRGDVLACVLLSVGITFSSLGLPFIAAAFVDVGMRPGPLRRLYVPAVPALIYAVWWAGWGHHAESALSFHNAAGAPEFVLDAAAAVFASLFGQVHLGRDPSAAGLGWGRPLLLVAVALGGWRLLRLGRVPRGVWIPVALVATFWVLAALNVEPGRDATVSRYQLPGAIFVLMIAAELLRGVRASTPAVVAAYVAGALVLAGNLAVLHDAYAAYRNTSDLIKADLGAVEVARDRLGTPIVLDSDIADTAYVHVHSSLYLSAADRYGSPADSPAQIASAPEPARVAADKVLGRALGIGLAPTRRTPSSRRGTCTELGGGLAASVLRLPPGGVIVHASRRAAARVALHRFATASFPVVAGSLPPGQAGVLRIPSDRATQPWELQLSSRSPAAVCGGLRPR